MNEKIKNISNLKVMDELTFVPTYKVIDKKHDLDTKVITVILANITNDFDVIKIEVSKDIGNLVEYDKEYSINTRTKRTWYTLWFGKKKEHSVLNNAPKKGTILVTNTPSSKKGSKDFQNEWKDTFKGE